MCILVVFVVCVPAVVALVNLLIIPFCAFVLLPCLSCEKHALSNSSPAFLHFRLVSFVARLVFV